MVRILNLWLVVIVLTCLACTRGSELPDDDELELFIEISSKCAYIERAYSHQKDLREAEMAAVHFPPNWAELADTLLARYGADADFWYEVYSEISARSREPLPIEEPGNVE